MLETALTIIFRICQIVAIFVLLFKMFSPTKIGQKFWNFMQNHKIIGIIILIMTAVGLFGTLFDAYYNP